MTLERNSCVIVCWFLVLVTYVSGSKRLGHMVSPVSVPDCSMISNWRPQAISDLRCQPYGSNLGVPRNITLIEPHPRFQSISLCRCRVVERRTICFTNLFFQHSVTSETRYSLPGFEECTSRCQKNGSTYKDLEPSFTDPDCRWMVTVDSTQRGLSVNHVTGVYDQLTHSARYPEILGHHCYLFSKDCTDGNHARFIFEKADPPVSCQATSKTEMALIENHVKGRLTAFLPALSLYLTFTYLCQTELCGMEVYRSTGGHSVAASSLTEFIERVHNCRQDADSIKPREELEEIGLIYEEGKIHSLELSSSICELAKNIIMLYLKTNLSIPESLLYEISKPHLHHNVYKVHGGQMYVKTCNAYHVSGYNYLCPGVWSVKDDSSLFLNARIGYLTREQPRCSLADDTHFLPGGFLVVDSGGSKKAVRSAAHYATSISELSAEDIQNQVDLQSAIYGINQGNLRTDGDRSSKSVNLSQQSVSIRLNLGQWVSHFALPLIVGFCALLILVSLGCICRLRMGKLKRQNPGHSEDLLLAPTSNSATSPKRRRL